MCKHSHTHASRVHTHSHMHLLSHSYSSKFIRTHTCNSHAFIRISCFLCILKYDHAHTHISRPSTVISTGCCSVLQSVTALQCVAMCRIVLQRVAPCCMVPQCFTECSTSIYAWDVRVNELQCVTTCRIVLQRVAPCCTVSLCFTECSSSIYAWDVRVCERG